MSATAAVVVAAAVVVVAVVVAVVVVALRLSAVTSVRAMKTPVYLAP